MRVREIYLSKKWRPATAKVTACYKGTIVDVDSLFIDVEFVLDGATYRKTEINTRQMRRNDFEPGSFITIFVKPNAAGQVVLDKRDTNFLDALARSFVMRFLPT